MKKKEIKVLHRFLRGELTLRESAKQLDWSSQKLYTRTTQYIKQRVIKREIEL